MGTSRSPLTSPFTADEREQLKYYAERLIREYTQKYTLDSLEAFREARLTLYEDFIKTYVSYNAKSPDELRYTSFLRSAWGRELLHQNSEVRVFSKMREEWDITVLGYLFEFLRGFLVSVEGGKIKLLYEKAGDFRSKSGAVFTPYEICELMIGNALQLFMRKNQDKRIVPDVLDPASGGGAFLIAFARALKAQFQTIEIEDIVLQHLYGIDVDPEAVSISLMSLWCLIGKSDLDPKRLECNFVAGNSLLPHNAPEKFHPINWDKKFPAIRKNGGFNIVIGNPPYVRQEKIRDLKPYLNNYESYSPTADLYIYFFEKGIELLKQGGILSFIASNSFLHTRSARPLRIFLKKNVRISDFFDAFQGPVFNAGVTPCILTLQKSAPGGSIQINAGGEIPLKCLEDRGWNFLSEKYLQLLGKFDRWPEKLEDFCTVYFCIKPGRVQDFVLNDKQISNLKLEEQLFQPVLRGADVKQYTQPVPKMKLLFPYHPVTFERLDISSIMERFPRVYQYLLERRESLEARDDFQRNKDHMGWYELRPCKYYPEFRQTKILTPDICHTNSFTIDTQGHFCLDTIFMILPITESISLDFLLGFLNSRPVELFLKMTCSSLGNRGFRYKKQFLEKIPIPRFEKGLMKQIGNLARESLNRENALHQAEIDQLVFQVLTFGEEEIQLVDRFLQGLP